jgi:hypothetical protein
MGSRRRNLLTARTGLLTLDVMTDIPTDHALVTQSSATRALAELTVRLDAATSYDELDGIQKKAELLRQMVKAMRLGAEWQNRFYKARACPESRADRRFHPP